MPQRFNEFTLLQQVAEAQTTAWVVKDLEHRPLLANQVYADSIGLRIEDIIGKTDRELGVCADVIPGRDSFENFCTQDLEELSELSGFSVRQIENAIRGGDYSSSDARTIRTPLVDVNGEVTAFLIQSRDLRDMRILENSLMESVKVRENELTLLNDFMVKMMSSQDLEVLLQNIADMMIEYTAAENAIVFLVGETREFLQAIVHSGPQKNPILEIEEHRAQVRQLWPGLQGRLSTSTARASIPAW